MPNTKSAKKRLRQSLVRRTRNRATKSALKKQTRKVVELVAAAKVPEAETEFRSAAKHLDEAAAAHVIHPNRAARLKSRLSAKLKAAKKK